MATHAPSQLVFLANEWEKLYGSAVLSGIVGDLAHKLRGGYHISIQDQPSTNYSVVRADDKAPPGNWPRDRASAVDMTMSTADMKKCHVRLRNAWNNRSNDVRMKYINAWNGWDGEGDAGRYDVVKGTVGTATPDHKWHIHLEIRRRYVNDRNAMLAILSILKGESLEDYLEEDMPTAREIADTLLNTKIALQPDGREVTIRTILEWRDAAEQGTRTEINANTNQGVAKLTSLVTGVANDVKAVKAGALDVDEAALAASLSTNPAFVEALATAIAAKVDQGQDVAAAVKSVLNEAKIVVA